HGAVAILRSMRSFFFVLRILFAWSAAYLLFLVLWINIIGRGKPWIFGVAIIVVLIVTCVRAFSHVHRVRLIADRDVAGMFSSRHRRQIEIPFPASEAFGMVGA